MPPARKPSKVPAETRRILAKLSTQYPNANTELHFSNPYELLVATILSAQCTDERVNQVTPALFKRYPDARALARATTAELEPQIQSTGFFRAKSRSLVGMASAVVQKHQGQIPGTMEQLTTLPGVGRKTANVVLGHALGVPGLPVDRHVLRVANRIGIARADDPEIVEQQLTAALPPKDWTRTSDILILHGRRICRPRPLCERCSVRGECDYYRTVIGAIVRAREKLSTSTGRKSVEIRRGPKARGTGGGGGAPPHIKKKPAEPRGTSRDGVSTDRSEIGKSFEASRAAKPRGTGGRNGVTTAGFESRKSVELRRAAEPRGTGRGGGAPRQTKE
jgi:endonuclease-3